MSSPTEPFTHAKPLHLVAGASLLMWNRALLRLRLRRRVDGWRRGAGLVLKGDAAKFVLSAFYLDVFSDDRTAGPHTAEACQRHLSGRLATFLSAEAECHQLVRHDAACDCVIAHDGPAYTLAFEPWVDGPARFIRPDSWTGTLGSPQVAGASPLFEFVCRIGPDQLADVWVRINHAGIDGVPAQEMLSRLEQVWGIGKPIIVPASSEFEPYTAPRFSPGRAGTAEVQTFIDFGPLLTWRKRQNEKLAVPLTFSAALMWCIARHETFAKRYIGTTVELPADAGIGRGVGIVVAQPAEYASHADGLARFATDFNRELELTRQRKSVGCKTLDAAAFLPAKLEEVLLRHALDRGAGAFGSVGLTILKDAKVFGAPLADTGHADGFIAVGSVALPSTDGKRVGCVVVKGPKERITSYPKVLKEAVTQLADE